MRILGSILIPGMVALVPSPHCSAGPLQPRAAPQEPGNTYLFLLLVEVVNDDAYEEVQGEEGTKDYEDDEVDVHVEVDLILWLLFNLARRHRKCETDPVPKRCPQAPRQGLVVFGKSQGVPALKLLTVCSQWEQPKEGTSCDTD